MSHRLAIVAIVMCVGFAAGPDVRAQDAAFVHPGGLHSQADLDRMKAKVTAGEHPWIDSWNALIAHPKAQNTYRAAPTADMGTNRQRASADAVAAYLNTLRWYISGDKSHADCAVRICNGWSAKVHVVHGGDLTGIPIYEFAVAGELLRVYPGWAPADFARFKLMMEKYLYPSCHDFLTNHEGTPVSHCWANWDLCNMTGILGIGVLCDDRAKFDEAVEYFKHGAGNGSIKNAVPFVYPNGLGQWQEAGRDQEHAQLGVGMMGAFCQIAWNQGDDLFGYDNNRYLAGAEYVAAYNMWKPVPYTFYNNADGVNNYWASEQTWGGRGRLQRPIWELIYNHYVVLKGLNAPNVKAMAELYRPEGIEHDDNFGFGTLAYTLNAEASPYPPAPIPPKAQDLTATAGVGRVWLGWTPCETANGYNVLRATNPGGPYRTIASYAGTSPVYEDDDVSNGTTYYYVIASKNQAGTAGNSAEVSATPAAAGQLPANWSQADVGSCSRRGSAGYADVSNHTVVMEGTGQGIGDRADGLSFVFTKMTGDGSITARRPVATFAGGGGQKIGLMIRESLDARCRALAMVSGDVGAREARFGARASEGTPMHWQDGDAYTPPNGLMWFRLKRAGDSFTAYQSIDGIKWFAVGSPVAVPMNATCLIGLAVSSNSDKVDAAQFDNIAVEGGTAVR